jgi:hypothetical protein
VFGKDIPAVPVSEAQGMPEEISEEIPGVSGQLPGVYYEPTGAPEDPEPPTKAPPQIAIAEQIADGDNADDEDAPPPLTP